MLLRAVVLLCLAGVFADKSPGFFLLAPNVFHVGEDETVVVTVSDAERPVAVHVCLLSYPNRHKRLACVQDNVAKDEQRFFSLKVSAEDLPRGEDPEPGRHAYLRVWSPAKDGFLKESKVGISYRTGVLLLHTDKPIYTPSQSVMIRAIPLSLELKPSPMNVSLDVQNPQGITVQRWKGISTTSGFITKTQGLSDSAMLGNWTITASYGHEYSFNASVKFEVRKYVLPTFSVSAEGPDYILMNEDSFVIRIRASYTYGKPVQGSTNVKLAIVGGRRRPPIFLSLKTKPLSKDGVAEFRIDVTSEIKHHPSRPWFPDGRRLQIEADVIEQATGKKESVIDNEIYFTKSPFQILVDDTPKYFKPALPFVIRIAVVYPSKKPAPGVPLAVSVTGTDQNGDIREISSSASNQSEYTDVTDRLGRAYVTVDVPRDVRSLEIRVSTRKGDIPHFLNARHTFHASAYYSPSGSFLHLKQLERGRVGSILRCEAYFTANTTAPLIYMVVARGKIVFREEEELHSRLVSTLSFTVKPAMVPSAFLVAYYVLESGEVVADSLPLDIRQQFPNQVEVSFVPDDGRTPPSIEVSAAAGSHVALMCVDQSVYLLRNRDKLNRKRAVNLFRALDFGCGVGGGADSNDVFKSAGMAALTSATLIESGQEESCAVSSQRKKRSAGPTTKELVVCCDQAKIPYRGRARCDARATFLRNVTRDCRLEFLRCCKIENNEKDVSPDGRGKQNIDLPAEVLEDALANTQIRNYFPETWIFVDGTTGDDGKYRVPVTLPDSISTWVLQAAAVSSEVGFGMAAPVDISTFKFFFVSLGLPYSVQRGEQVSVMATVYNYREQSFKVNLYVEGSDAFCSTSRPGEKSQAVTMEIKAHDAQSMAFPIVPVKLGRIDVTVFAVSELGVTDAVRRSVLVVPEGVERRITRSLVLDPQGILRDETTDGIKANPSGTVKVQSGVHKGKQLDHVMLNFPKTAIPGSIRASLYLTGNLIGPAVTSLIHGGGLATLLQMPMGCGEQTMMHMAPNVYVLQYLRNSKQVTEAIETQAYKFIQLGYQRELNYRRADRSFSAFGESRPGSTWLTAFVVKVFCATQKFSGIELDEVLICDSVAWLVENQRQDGAFPEMKNVIHTSMMGGVDGNVAMTAFVLISLLECDCQDQNKELATRNAVRFLETEVALVEKPNVLAITSYALAMAASRRFPAVNAKLWSKAIRGNDTNSRYWEVGGHALNVETAGYALLAQMAGGRLKSAGPIVTWLTEQRNSHGGFLSTQDTCVALQALAKYSEKTAGAELSLRVALSSEINAEWGKLYTIRKHNAFIQRHIDITRLLDGQIFIDTNGTGVGQMQIEVKYNAPSSKNETCAFHLSIDMRELGDDGSPNANVVGKSRVPRATGGKSSKKKKRCRNKNGRRNRKRCKPRRPRPTNKPKTTSKPQPQGEEKRQTAPPETIQINICTRYLKPGKAGMTIMEIGIFTGYTPDEGSLEELKKNVRPTVDRFEFSHRAVVLYISEVQSTHDFCASFKVTRVFEVGAVQPVPVKIYDYYEPENGCTEFYSPGRGSELLLGICNGEQCKCTQKECTPCDIGLDDPHELAAKACNDYEFVIIVEVEVVDERERTKQSWLTYFVTVKEVFKRGKTKFRKGGSFEFMKRAGCKCPDLTEGKQYLVLGRDALAVRSLDDKDLVMLWEKKKSNKAQLEEMRARMSKHPRCRI